MSASLVVDLGSTAPPQASIVPANGVGSSPASGAIIGIPVDFQHNNVLCNLIVAAGVSQSGTFRVAVQTSPDTTSGNFTDPTSGLSQLPTKFLSGGILLCNSGSAFVSGYGDAAGFQRPHRYVRAVVLAGDQHNAPVWAGFLSQQRTTGSGGGFSLLPGSGSVSV